MRNFNISPLSVLPSHDRLNERAMWSYAFPAKRYHSNLMQCLFLALALSPLGLFGLLLNSRYCPIVGLNPQEQIDTVAEKFSKSLRKPLEQMLELSAETEGGYDQEAIREAENRLHNMVEALFTLHGEDLAGLAIYRIEKGIPRSLVKRAIDLELKPEVLKKTDASELRELTQNHLRLHMRIQPDRQGDAIYLGLQIRQARFRGSYHAALIWMVSTLLILSIMTGFLSWIISRSYLEAANYLLDKLKSWQRQEPLDRINHSKKFYPPPWGVIHAKFDTCFNIMEDRDQRRQIEYTHQLNESHTRCHQAEKAYQDLQATHEAAKKELIARTEMLANISHEVRTPMNSILGFVQTLLQSQHLPRHREMLEIIESSSKTLLRILNDLLDLSRLEAGTLYLHPQPFLLRDTFEEIITFLAPSAHEKGLELILNMPNTLPLYLLGDSVRLKQILTNMVNNAIKFTSKGWIEVKLTFQPISATAKATVIRVDILDTGIGVSPSDYSRIFERFGQALDTTASQAAAGSGLGLVICRKLAQAMSGEVGLSEKCSKRGANFWFTAKFDMLSETGQPPRLLSNFSEQTLIYLSDCRRVFKSLERLLVHEKLKLHHCKASDEQALKGLTSSIQADTFLVDYPWSGGWPKLHKMLSRLKQNFPAIRRLVVIPSGLAQEFQSHFSRLECQGYLIRPFTHRKISELLQQAHSLAPALPDAPVPVQQSPSQRTITATLVQPKMDCVVLAVDDHWANLKLIETYLEPLTKKFWTCNDGLNALQIFQREHIDLVLMDIQMPNLNGIQVLQAFKQLKKFGQTPVIALTARAFPGEQEQLKHQGFVDIITKPISYAQIKQLVKRYARTTGSVEHEKPEKIEMTSPEGDAPGSVSSTDQPKIFNHKEALETVRHNKHLLTHLLQGFMGELGQAIAYCERPIEQMPNDFSDFLHQLQGSAAYCGSKQLNTEILEVLRALNRKSAPKTEKQIRKLQKLMVQTKSEIEKVLTA